jgi:hypothetical protein
VTALDCNRVIAGATGWVGGFRPWLDPPYGLDATSRGGRSIELETISIAILLFRLCFYIINP